MLPCVTELPNVCSAPLPLMDVVPVSSPMAMAGATVTAVIPAADAAIAAVANIFFMVMLSLRRQAPLRSRMVTN
ncbi:hypothetical protein GCM10012286_27050 [Streptomyces lasiicapitis]|uniref:Uncharacterized protein n=1 Tax=Streptomyces lasiicapitis TaxID=1923961 RepID=A0ABQ2LUS8_9ACTN|nr:hypothetical protein GCM10012286_27050 [Streptomyces lasiicapitis]